MSHGPIELLVVKFPGNKFTGQIVPALTELVDNGTVRIIDLLFVQKDADGDLTIVELTELDEDERAALDPVVADVSGMISDDDALLFANALEPNSSAGLLLFENTWASRFVSAVREADGEVIVSERIPRAVIEELAAVEAED